MRAVPVVPARRRMSRRSSLARRAVIRGAALLAACLAGTACADSAVLTVLTPPAPAAVDSTVVSLSRARLELITGFEPTATLQATVSGALTAGGPPALVWSSADTTVATVTPGPLPGVAVVTARRAGETTITVRAATSAPTGIMAVAARAESRVVVTDPPPMPWPAVPPTTADVGGLTVRAATTADASPAGAPAGTVRFVVTATLTNATAAAVTVRAGGCPLSFSLHQSGSWFNQPGHPLVWDQLAQGRGCAAAGAAPGETITLAPGASRTLTTTVLSTDILALTPGSPGVPPSSTLGVHAHVRVAPVALPTPTDTADVVVQAGSMAFTLPTDRLAFRATVATRGAAADTLAARVTLTNQAALPTYLEFGACAVRLLAYRTADRLGPPAWNSDLRQPWEGTYGRGCLAYLATRTVAAGADFSPGEFALDVPLIEVLGDSLPDGRYYVTAQARLSNVATPAVDAGAVDLALARGPLPAERTYGFVTYRAATVPGGGTVAGAGAVRVGVTATLTNAGGALVRYPVDCVVRIAAYRTRAARDAAPRGGPPDWAQPTAPTAGCAAGEAEVTLTRGESRTFATQAAAREILGATLPPGRYYFAAVVRAPGRLVYLAAGDADLAR